MSKTDRFPIIDSDLYPQSFSQIILQPGFSYRSNLLYIVSFISHVIYMCTYRYKTHMFIC